MFEDWPRNPLTGEFITREEADAEEEINELEASRDRCVAALGVAVRTIAGLADQQTMEDDWYKPFLEYVSQTWASSGTRDDLVPPGEKKRV